MRRAVLLLLFCGHVWAADWNVSTTGTRTSCTNGNGDWSAAETYGNVHAVFFTCGASMSDGDQIVINDGSYSHNNTRCAAVAGSYTIKSRNDDANLVTFLSNSASASAWNLNCAETVNVEFKDLSFSHLGTTFTATATNPMMYIHAETNNVTFTRIQWKNLTYTTTGNNSTLTAPINSRFEGVDTARTVTFADNTFTDFAMTAQNAGSLILYANTGTTLVFTGTNEASNLSFTSTGTDTNDGLQGVFYGLANVPITINGALNGSNITSTVLSGNANGSFLRAVNTGAITLAADAEVNCTDFTWTGEGGTAACVWTTGPFVMGDGWVTGTRVSVTNTDETLGLGAVFLAQDSTAAGRAKVRCIDSDAWNGPAIYASNGGTGTWVVDSYNCRARIGVVYFGGDGDNTLSGLIRGSDSKAGEDAVQGMDVYAHNHVSTATRAKVTNLYNLTIGPAQNTSIPSVYLTNNNTTHAHTANLYNNIFDGGNTLAVEATEAASTTLNVTGRTNRTAIGSIDTSDVVTGTVSVTGTTTGDAGFVDRGGETADSYRLAGDSTARRAGTDRNLGNIQDLGDRAFMHPPSLGAWEAASRDEAGSRTPR